MNVISTCQCVNLILSVTTLLGATTAFVMLAILEMVSPTVLVSLQGISLKASIVHNLLQISMNVNLTLTTVMRMLSALIPLAALPVLAMLDTLGMEHLAVSVADHWCIETMHSDPRVLIDTSGGGGGGGAALGA